MVGPQGKLAHSFQQIISLENLLEAWQEFIVGKRDKIDVQEFERQLMDHLICLRDELVNHTYRHGGYQAFKINDPKPRDIHKASVRDRLLHHAIYRVLYPYFDRRFIADSFSCRNNKGTHKALDRFRDFARIVSRNHRRTCWVLKLDIRKFFASVDHAVLKSQLARAIDDQETLWLLQEIIGSFSVSPDVGLPLGNLTSQLLVNIYMNDFDQFVKHKLKAKYYLRYADDFVFLSPNRQQLVDQLPRIEQFLMKRLHLRIHPDKLVLKTVASGVDYLGWVHFADHRVLRTKTKQRMMRRLHESNARPVVQSYLGLLSHGNAKRLQALVASKIV